MKKYNKKEYLKYVKDFKKDKKRPTSERPTSFEKWRVCQPIADKVIGESNKIIKGGLK